MDRTFDFVISGAGIIGLATAISIRKKHHKASIAIVEKEPAPGLHASGRNSGVIHSGIYYPPGSLKAKVCARGGEMMTQFALEHGVRLRRSGKVIIATREADLAVISRLMENAAGGGLRAERLDAAAIREIEPHCQPYEAGIYVPGTAVVDSKGILAAMADKLKHTGVEFFFGERVTGATADGAGVSTTGGSFSFGHFFNCAGAYADVVARSFNVGMDYRLVPFKGIYYKLRPEKYYLARGNIYPVPDINFPFLGVHFTRSIDDEVFAGPTAIPALGRENYGIIADLNMAEAFETALRLIGLYINGGMNFRALVREEIGRYSRKGFWESCRRLVPSIGLDDIVASGKAGIRPQLINVRERRFEMDFLVERAPRSTHVLNAVSPAFTSALSFAEEITAGI
ncbi:MAG: L-2-hydroxyglutarate oxidase [Nitrospinae bacterium]|nr:L-2-hydroxyglutarate oxidase [Nitrospinota bacterium]